jgi:flagellin
MLSGLSPNLTTAIRTAGEARRQVDDATRQLATGKRVASARDDGARYAQALAARSQATAWGAVEDAARFQAARMQHKLSASEASDSLYADTMNTLLAMTRPGLSAQTFEALRQEASASFDRAGMGWQQNTWGLLQDQVGGDATGMDLLQPDGSVTSSRGWLGAPTQWGTASNVGPVWTVTRPSGSLSWNDTTRELVIADAAAAKSALDFMTEVMGYWRTEVGAQGASLRRAEAQVIEAGRQQDRLARADEALTDADLGQVAARRATAETRQQLALQTVRAALDAYGAYAGGLLGNAQRSQRSVLA